MRPETSATLIRTLSRLLSEHMFACLLRVLRFLLDQQRSDFSLEMFVCAMYLEYGASFDHYFVSTIAIERMLLMFAESTKVSQHRRRSQIISNAAWQGHLDPILCRVLWRAIRIAAVRGKKAGLEHFMSALALDDLAVGRLAAKHHLLLRGYLGELRPIIYPVLYEETFVFQRCETFPERARFDGHQNKKCRFLLRVMNGIHPSLASVRTARLRLNGRKILTETHINSEIAHIATEVALKRRNLLDVWLDGVEGSGVHIVVEAQPCPA